MNIVSDFNSEDYDAGQGGDSIGDDERNIVGQDTVDYKENAAQTEEQECREGD